MKTKLKLLSILADGKFHSGETLGETLGVSRTAVWKQIQALKQSGIDCYSVNGKGYRLAEPLELLDQEAILAAMTDKGRQRVSALEVHHEIDSTSRYLLDKLGQGLEHGHVCLAERQTAGRGRRGRRWVSPFARNIYLSFYWRFDMSPDRLAGLGLAIGVGVVRALQQLGIKGVNLKWPNDVLWQGRKLAGVLLDMRGETTGPYHVVVGVGLNIEMSGAGDEIDQAWIDLASISTAPISRNRVAAVLLEELLCISRQFQDDGLEPFLHEWLAADACTGKSVIIYHGDEHMSGKAKGIDASGAILVETDVGLRRFHSGEVSLRMQS